jgi:Holliday junction resolvasome RuvABC DNA-binding subunit
MILTTEAKEALKSLVHLGYPRQSAKKAVWIAMKTIPESSAHDFERIFRAAMTALR